MIYTVRYTPETLRDLDTVWDGVYEASKDPDTTETYINGFLSAIEEKKQFPYSGVPLRYRGLFTGFYYIIYKKYLAFYRVRDNRVEVIRIIMAKRDYMKILFGVPEENREEP